MRKPKQRRPSSKLYMDLVADRGRSLFSELMGVRSATRELSRSPSPSLVESEAALLTNTRASASVRIQEKAKTLTSTPSMLMLSEAAALLSEGPGSMAPMDGVSTGGVYQLRRRREPLHSSQIEKQLTEKRVTFSGVPKSFEKAPNLRRVQTLGLLSQDGISLDSFANEAQRSETVGSLHDLVHQAASLSSPRVPVPKRPPPKKGGSRVAVFKPEDEETGAKASARIGERNPERAGMIVGGGAKRERAAYLLDKNAKRFSDVPETALIAMPSSEEEEKHVRSGKQIPRMKVMKRGSLQRFMESDGSAEDRPDLVREASSREVHKIAILDIRLFNTDRHGGNVLCKNDQERGNVKLIPIDHGLSLPDWHFLNEAFFDWSYWHQVGEPCDAETLQTVADLDVENDATTLRNLGFPEACVTTCKIATIALKVSLKNGLTLKDLGQMFQRPFCPGHLLHNKRISPLEHMVMLAAQRTGLEYTPAGSRPNDDIDHLVGQQSSFQEPDGTDVELDDDDDDEDCQEEDCIDIDSKEREAFGNKVPPTSFFTHFAQVIAAYTDHNNIWTQWLATI